MFDITFISYNEPNADENWRNLLARFPYAKRLHGVKGIHLAHKTAAQLPGTSHLWIVDGDSTINQDFNFCPPEEMQKNQLDGILDAVYVYRALNPVNGLNYGYGGIKLLPRKETAAMSLDNVDMTTSISDNFFPINQIASTTNFNTDPFNTWKSAFRECVKLSSKVIDNQVNKETEQRLDTWCTAGNEKPYGDMCIKGAQAGRAYGLTNRNNVEALKLINDFNWLQERWKTL
jgi:hypothetical protein